MNETEHKEVPNDSYLLLNAVLELQDGSSRKERMHDAAADFRVVRVYCAES